MSDSDDDGAFASADEGDVVVAPQKAKQEVPKKVATDAVKSSTAEKAPEKTDVKKDTGKKEKVAAAPKEREEKPPQKSKKQKKKGKGGEKQMPKKDGAGKKKVEEKSEEMAEPQSATEKVKDKADVKAEEEAASAEVKSLDTKQPEADQENPKEVTAEAKKECKPDVSGETDPKTTEESSEKKSDIQDNDKSNISEPADVSPSTLTKGKEGTPESAATKEATLVKSPSAQDISRPEPDRSSQQEEILERLGGASSEPKKSGGGGWGWGSWGSSLLDVASTSVNTFKNQVGEGFHTMIETVESTLNVPSPEELAEDVNKTKDDIKEPVPEDKESDVSEEKDQSGDKDKPGTEEDPDNSESKTEPVETVTEGAVGGDWFSNISNMVQSTSKKLVEGSLDVLETVGKKTFDVIKEHDPGLKKTRNLVSIRGNKPNLSSVLRDAKARSEEQLKQEKETEESMKVHFGTLFDDFQGLAHLEALEILSNQSEKKVSNLLSAIPPELISGLKPQLLQIKQCFEIAEDDEDEDGEDEREHDFPKLISEHLDKLGLPLHQEKLKQTQKNIRGWIVDFTHHTDEDREEQAKATHQEAIKSLAEMTSKSIEQFHKIGELVLFPSETPKDCVAISTSLACLTKVLNTEIGILSTKFSNCLNACSESTEHAAINTMVTNVYLEATNSSSYIQDGFQLLLPVIQEVTIEQTQTADDS